MDAFLRFRCPSCRKHLKAKPEQRGRTAKCICGDTILVPAPAVSGTPTSRPRPRRKLGLLEILLTSGIVLSLILTGFVVWQRTATKLSEQVITESVDKDSRAAHSKPDLSEETAEAFTDATLTETVMTESSAQPAITAPNQADPTEEEIAAQPPTVEIPVTVNTNVYGANLVVRNGNEEILRKAFQRQDQSLEFTVPDDGKPYPLLVEVGGVAATKENHRFSSGETIDVNFQNSQFTELHRAAACLLLIPGGGFGSGFLLGDRQTIATAAHCVACKDVTELEIVFHPTEPQEFTISGAQIIYFDAKQDVALLHLPEEVPGTPPYFWSPSAAEQEDRVIVLGNPGRAGFPDPMYSRSASVKGTRPDEFFVDIEVKPGYSGGPVIETSSMNAVGITSYKFINTENYEQDGQSFAKSAKIAADAYRHWTSLSSQSQATKLDRERRHFEERFQYIEANEVAMALMLDSFQFLNAINDVIDNYNDHMGDELSKLPNPVSEIVFWRVYRKAHRDYVKEQGPKMAEQIRERISPNLLLERGYSERYESLLKDQELPEDLKDHLTHAREHYETLREALEHVVTPSRRTSAGKTLDEFAEFIVDELNGVLFHCQEVTGACEGRLQ